MSLEVNKSSCKTVVLWMFVWSSFRCLISNTVECKQVGVDADLEALWIQVQ